MPNIGEHDILTVTYSDGIETARGYQKRPVILETEKGLTRYFVMTASVRRELEAQMIDGFMHFVLHLHQNSLSSNHTVPEQQVSPWQLKRIAKRGQPI